MLEPLLQAKKPLSAAPPYVRRPSISPSTRLGSASVAQGAEVILCNLAEDAAHDLARASLGGGAVLLAPPIIGLLTDRDPATCLGGRRLLRQHNLRFTQLADNLFRARLLARQP